MRLGQAPTIGAAVTGLNEALDAMPADWHPGSVMSPVRVLLEHIGQKYAPVALDLPLERLTAPLHLRQQCDLIGWYSENGLAFHAVLLSREWLVTYLSYKMGHEDLLYYKLRLAASDLLRVSAGSHDDSAAMNAMVELSAFVSDPRLVVRMWRSIVDVRNALAHMGMRSRPGHNDVQVDRTLAEIHGDIRRLVDSDLPVSDEAAMFRAKFGA